MEIQVGASETKCVLIPSQPLSWDQAKQFCENNGSYLLTFSSASSSQLFGNYLSGSMGESLLCIYPHCIRIPILLVAYSIPTAFINKLKNLVISLAIKGHNSNFAGYSNSRWWIGGHRIASCWYWRGILTGQTPTVNDAESDWHSAHNPSGDGDCLYYQTGTSPGWNSHSTTSCFTALPFICEKQL